MPQHLVDVTKKGHILTVSLNHPAVSPELAAELVSVCSSIQDDESVYVVVLTGTGNVFCKSEVGDLGDNSPAAAVAAIDRPVIAAINGEASGPGLEIALSCDIRIASDKALFSLPQVAQGNLPGGGGTQRLPRIIGRGKALELLLTAESIPAAEALEIGLVSKVVPSAELAGETQKLAETIAAKGPLALRYLKEAIIKGMDMTLEQGLRLEADLYFLLHTTADRTEGIKAYREKRKPDYQGK
jgi:enoyl-CoA hydratase/carnithine racemase